MHCPRCGQEQADNNIKFCSRCGLPLSLVADVVANGGTLPGLSELSAKTGWFTRANGLKFSLIWFVVIEMLLVPLVAITGGEEEVAVLAILGFVGAVLIVIVSFMFFSSAPKSLQAAAANSVNELGSMPMQNQALPPVQGEPAASYASPAGTWKAPDTGDLVRPPSVTEGTTKLLKKEEESR